VLVITAPGYYWARAYSTKNSPYLPKPEDEHSTLSSFALRALSRSKCLSSIPFNTLLSPSTFYLNWDLIAVINSSYFTSQGVVTGAENPIIGFVSNRGLFIGIVETVLDGAEIPVMGFISKRDLFAGITGILGKATSLFFAITTISFTGETFVLFWELSIGATLISWLQLGFVSLSGMFCSEIGTFVAYLSRVWL